MPYVIVKSCYMTERTHIVNYMRYIATREGVEHLPPSMLYRTASLRQQMFIADHQNEMRELPEYKAFEKVATIDTASRLITAYAQQASLSVQEYREYAAAAREQPKIGDDSRPATDKQTQFIEKHMEEAEGLPEYEDYLKNATVGNASALIGLIAEQHPTDPTMYLRYIAERPGVEKTGKPDGLFGLRGKADLDAECERVLQSESVVWAHIVSLHREDAERVGMDNAEAWRRQIVAEAPKIAELYHISTANLRLFGAFHNEGHHPHVHLLVYSDDPKEGVIPKKQLKMAGEKMRSILTNGIFRDDLAPIKTQKTQVRDEMRKQIQDYKNTLYGKDVKVHPKIIEAICALSGSLPATGKKQYAFMPKKIKSQVNDLLRLIVRTDPVMGKLSEIYFDCERSLLEQYHDDPQMIEDKLAETINRFYEPRTGKYAKNTDAAAMHNSIIHWAYALHMEGILPNRAEANKPNGEEESAANKNKVKSEALPVPPEFYSAESSEANVNDQQNSQRDTPPPESFRTDSEEAETLPVFLNDEPAADATPKEIFHDDNDADFPTIITGPIETEQTSNATKTNTQGVHSIVAYIALLMLRDLAGCLETRSNNDNTYTHQARRRKQGRRPRRSNIINNMEEPHEQ